MLKMLSMLDWATPLWHLLVNSLGRLVGIRRWQFEIPFASGWAFRDVEALLKQNGIKPKGTDFDALTDSWSLWVNEAQASQAEALLLSSGVPLAGYLYDADNTRHLPEGTFTSRPASWGKLGNALLWGALIVGIAALVVR